MVRKSSHSVLFILAKAFVMELLLCGSTCGQEEMMGIPYIRNYAPSEYNAHVQNFDIVQNQEGIMYFANFSGVLEFDGQSWRTIQTSNMSQVTSLCIDSLGIIYVGARGELGRLIPKPNGELVFHSLMRHLKGEKKVFQYVIKTFATKNGVYFVTDKNVLLWQDSVFIDYGISGEINSAFFLDNTLYILEREAGLQFLYKNKLHKVFTSPGITQSFDINTAIPYQKDKLLLGTGGLGLLLLENDTLKTTDFPAQSYLQGKYISSGALLSDGSIALGTIQDGLVILNIDGSLKQTINQGVQNEYIRDLYVDKSGFLWMALDNGIAMADIPSIYSFFNEEMGLEGKVNHLASSGNIVYFATNKGLFEFKNGYSKVKRIKELNVACWSVVLMGDELVVATSKGVLVINDEGATQLTDEFSLTLFQSRIEPQKIYVGLLEGIRSIVMKNNQWQVNDKAPNFNDEVTEIEEDNFGMLSLAVSTKGIVRYNPCTNYPPVLYDDNKGLPSRFDNHLNRLNEAIIISTQQGLYSFNKEKNAYYPLKKCKGDTSLVREWFFQLIEDYNNNFWYTKGDGKSIQVLNNSKFNSLLKPLENKTISKIIPGKNGALWFIETNGVIRFNPGVKKVLDNKIYTLTRNIKLGGDSVIFGGSLMLDGKISFNQPGKYSPLIKYKDNTLFFRFACPSYSMNENVEFRYFLEGFDKDTSSWSSSITKEYTNIPPGDYNFIVEARNVYDIKAKTSQFSFTIDKPFYRTIFAYIVYVVILMLIIALIVRQRSKKLVKEKQKLEQKVKERTAELEEEKNKTERLLLNILPKQTADELKKYNRVTPRDYKDATVLFTDFKGFTKIAESLTPKQLVDEIDYCFKSFDAIIDTYNIEKIKTIGDSYMCASGLPELYGDNANEVIKAALEIRDFMEKYRRKSKKTGKPYFEIRIGVHSGKLVAGVVGTKKYAYDIWGDTVNVASRMESSGVPGKVNISGDTYEKVKEANNEFTFEYRGKIEAKNKGEVDMYFVERIKK